MTRRCSSGYLVPCVWFAAVINPWLVLRSVISPLCMKRCCLVHLWHLEPTTERYLLAQTSDNRYRRSSEVSSRLNAREMLNRFLAEHHDGLWPWEGVCDKGAYCCRSAHSSQRLSIFAHIQTYRGPSNPSFLDGFLRVDAQRVSTPRERMRVSRCSTSGPSQREGRLCHPKGGMRYLLMYWPLEGCHFLAAVENVVHRTTGRISGSVASQLHFCRVFRKNRATSLERRDTIVSTDRVRVR